MKRLIVFDLDDTLYLERDYVRSGFAAVDAWASIELGVSGVGEIAWHLFLRGVRGTTLTDAFAAAGHPLGPAATMDIIGIYRSHWPSITLCPDTEGALASLAGTAHVAVLTDGPRRSQRAKLAALRLSRWVEAIVVTDEHIGWAKPAAAGFIHLQRQFDVEPAACIYIGDNPDKDFDASRRLRWRSIRINRPESLHTNAPSPGMVQEIVDLGELATNLDEVFHKGHTAPLVKEVPSR